MAKKLKLFIQEDIELFKKADEILGISLSTLIDEGPEQELNRTSVTQPALLVMGIACSKAMEKLGFNADITMGHSLGEYAALVYCGVISLDEGLNLVRMRGQLMEKAVEKTPGKMAAVIGTDNEKLQDLLAQCRSQGVLDITNFNAPMQVVLSGETKAVELAITCINMNGLGKAIMLNVSVPFHSSLMVPVAEEFAQYLSEVKFKSPQIAFIDNVTGLLEADPERIKNKLVTQLTSPVLWEKSVRTAQEAGAKTFIESGPGCVLSGLVKRIVKGANIIAAERVLSSP
jgi:[acyl-carrier-protein] S-malonyltransferase